MAVLDVAAVVLETDQEPRCWRCRKKLAEFLTRPWSITCQRCHALNSSAPTQRQGRPLIEFLPEALADE